ncbi:hypothetical protein [Actibacterium sp. MT2.3-13A]|uniref:hypothetical protein n=1 Tax=Actibacterium sp. MT2.3-13A TaxID=2828332 RepID=UPI001BA8ABC3|nr:hypothetical protein [Actibacterium sp. MT2.3-13A]
MTMNLSLPPAAASSAADPVLRCVAVPLIERDIGSNLAALLALWSDDRFFPVLDPRTPRPHLMVMANNATPERLAEAEAIFRAHPRLGRCFSGFSAHSAGLSGDRDLYARGRAARKGAFGTRAGPNFLFHRTLEQAGRHGGFTLQVELDCLPVQAGWIEAAQEVIAGHASAWVIGSVYAGVGELDTWLQSHLNGNALYRTGDGAFQSFLSGVWMPRIQTHVQRRPDLAYDCWWALERSQANARAANESWFLFQTFDGFFHADPFIVNLLVPPQGVQAYSRIFEKFARLGRTPVFFHGPAMKALSARLLDHPKDSIFEAIDRMAPAQTPRAPVPPLRRAAPAAGPADPLPEGGDWLDRLAGRTRADAGANARLLLRAVAARLQLDPGGVLPRLEAASVLHEALEAARAELGDGHAVVAYFERALNAARAQGAA